MCTNYLPSSHRMEAVLSPKYEKSLLGLAFVPVGISDCSNNVQSVGRYQRAYFRITCLLHSFWINGSLIVWTLPFLPNYRVLVPSWGSFRGAFGCAVRRGGLWGVTCLRQFFGGSVFVLERGGIMFAVTDSPPRLLLDHVLLLMCNHSS